MSEYFLQQKFKTRNILKEKAELTRKERSAGGCSQELPKSNISDGSLVVKSPLLTDRDIPYYNSYQSPKTGDTSIYQIMQSLNKNTTKSASYLNKKLNHSKSPAQSKQQNASQSSVIEFIKTPPSSTLHKTTQSAMQNSQDRYNLQSTSQEISKQILQNLRQTKNKSDVSVKQVDPSSFVVNKLEQEKLNCNMCFRKDTKYFKATHQQQKQKQPNLGVYQLEPIKMIFSSDENDLTRQLINVNNQLTNKLNQLKKLYDYKQQEWRQLVDELRNEIINLLKQLNEKQTVNEPACLKNCEVLLQMTPVEVQFENLFNQAIQQFNNKYEKIIKDLYSKIQIQNNADMILKQLAQNGKQSERAYLKLIEDLRQKYNKQQKLIADSQSQLSEQNAKLVQVQECIKLIQELIGNSENLKKYKLKKQDTDFDDVLAILQIYRQLDAKITDDQKKFEESKQILQDQKEQQIARENELERQINELRETIEALEKKATDPVKQRISLSAVQEEQNVIKELAMIILSKSVDGDIQDKVSGILRRTYGDVLYKNELLIQELQQKNMLIQKQLEFEKELTGTLRKQLNHFYEKFLLISKSFDCIPKRVLETNEVLQVAAKTISQAKPIIIQEYIEMQSTQSDQEDELLTRQSLTIDDPGNNGNKILQRSLNQSNKSFQNYFSPKNKEEDFHYMLLLQAITIEEYVYQTNEQTNELPTQIEIQPPSQSLRPQFSFNIKDKFD